MMFTNWIYFWVPKVSFVLSFITNALLLNFAQYSNSAISGDYQSLIGVYIAWNVCSSIWNLNVTLAVQNVNYTAVIFITDGFFTDSRAPVAFILSQLSLNFGNFAIITTHFIYRFVFLRWSEKLSKFFKNWGILAVIAVILLQTAIVFVSMLIAIPDNKVVGELHLREYFRERYEVELSSVTMVAGVFANSNHELIFWTWIVVAIVAFLICGHFTAWVVLGTVTLHSLITGSGMTLPLSYRTTKSHIKLSKMVFLLCSIPFLSTILLLVPLFCASVFGVSVHEYIYLFPSLFYSMSNFLTPLSIILYMPQMRNGLISYFYQAKNWIFPPNAVAPVAIAPVATISNRQLPPVQ